MPKLRVANLKKLSLKSRLVFAAIIWLTAMIIAAGVTVPTQVLHYMVEDSRDQLSIYMDEMAGALNVNDRGELSLSSGLSDPRFTRPYSGFYWQASTDSDTLRSRSLWDQTLTFKGPKKHKGKSAVFGAKGEKLITMDSTLYFPDYNGPIQVTIGMDEQPIEATVTELMGQLWLILGLLYLGLLTVIMLQVEWSLSPLGKMKKELAELRRGEKSRLDEAYPKDVAPVISDLNALLFHYQELLERARHHAGNLSHALKTPLSVLKNEIRQLGEAEQAKLTPAIDQIQHQIDYHLGRARMAGAKNILAVKSNPAERVDAITLAFDKIYANRGLTVINELDSDIELAVEQTDLDEMLGNLLENAYKWASSMIRIYSVDVITNEAKREADDGYQLSIVIEDNGPGIAKEHIQQVLKRGVRLDEHTPGSGLGLNIVQEMAHSYRGALSLEAGAQGGLKAILTMQRASATKKHKR